MPRSETKTRREKELVTGAVLRLNLNKFSSQWTKASGGMLCSYYRYYYLV